MSGISEETRETTLAERFGEYTKEVEGFQKGPTYTQLQSNFAQQGGQGTMEEYYAAQYGGYEPKGVTGEPGAQYQPAGPAGRAPGGTGSEAAVAGLGESRPWWAAVG